MKRNAERIRCRKLLKCEEVIDDMAVKLLGPVAKASRLTKMKLMDIGFDELVKKHRDIERREIGEFARSGEESQNCYGPKRVGIAS